MKNKDTLEGRNAAPAATRTTTSRGRRAPKGVLRRLLKTLFEFYPVLLPVTLVCILINALVSSMPAVFLQKVISLVDQSYKSGDWSAVSGKILGYVGILVAMYVVSLIAGAFYTQMMATAATPRAGMRNVSWIAGSMKHIRPATRTHEAILTTM